MINNNLKSLRSEKGYTQEELCDELKKFGCPIERSTYSKYETGTRSIPCNVLIKLASFYQTTCDYILGL